MCPKRKPIGIILVIKVTVSLEIPIGVMIYTVGLDSDQRRQSSGAALETIVLRGGGEEVNPGCAEAALGGSDRAADTALNKGVNMS